MGERDSSRDTGLTHLDAEGRARMVDVGGKPVTHRRAVARCTVRMQAETLDRIGSGRIAKGDVLATARIAGIQAAKRTAEWIPLAHPLPLDAVEVELTPDVATSTLGVEARVETHWKTGVEMEALVAVSAAALTIYDMCKAIDRGMSIDAVRLVAKSGGRSGDFGRAGEPSARDGEPSARDGEPPAHESGSGRREEGPAGRRPGSGRGGA